MEGQTTLAVVLAGILGSGGILGGLFTLLKWRPENDKTNVFIDAAQGAVLVQTGVITTLQDQLHEMTAKIEALENEVKNLSHHLDEVVLERDRLRAENTWLKTRIDNLKGGNGVR